MDSLFKNSAIKAISFEHLHSQIENFVKKTLRTHSNISDEELNIHINGFVKSVLIDYGLAEDFKLIQELSFSFQNIYKDVSPEDYTLIMNLFDKIKQGRLDDLQFIEKIEREFIFEKLINQSLILTEKALKKLDELIILNKKEAITRYKNSKSTTIEESNVKQKPERTYSSCFLPIILFFPLYLLAKLFVYYYFGFKSSDNSKQRDESPRPKHG